MHETKSKLSGAPPRKCSCNAGARRGISSLTASLSETLAQDDPSQCFHVGYFFSHELFRTLVTGIGAPETHVREIVDGQSVLKQAEIVHLLHPVFKLHD